MFTKMLVVVCCVAVAILSFTTESLADTIEVIEIDPRQFHQKQQNNQCQQYMNYYDNYYKNAYNKYYNDYYYNYWRQQSANQQVQIPNVPLPEGTKVEWVCTNPKTKDQMIIGSKNVPVGNGQQYYPVPPQHGHQQPNYPPQHGHQQPNYPPQHGHQQPNYPPQHGHQQPNHNYPPQQPQPSFPTDQPQNPHVSQPQQPQEPQTDKPNTNGEGIIDIRFGDD